MRLEAADQLAELPARLWSKGANDDWVQMNMAVDRLAMRLGLAGVPPSVTANLSAAAGEFWEDVHEVDAGADAGLLAVGTEMKDQWDEIAAAVGELLSSGSVLRRRRIVQEAKKVTVQPSTPEITVGSTPESDA